VSDPSSAPEPSPGDSWGAQKALQVLALAFLFPAAIVVGYLAGRWLGVRVGAPTAGGLIGSVVGAVAGFWQLYLFLRRSSQG
jgi:hypothetical protein